MLKSILNVPNIRCIVAITSKCMRTKLSNKMKRVNMSLIYLLILLNGISALKSVDYKPMSLASNQPMNATIVRYKRYLDFIPKSRMFVSIE